ncbi:site-specific integrase [Geminicoccus flavidas]|uniref:site-specific integrase n=1 Tax=Geminicoccus flavidas TaxID=2506407 RepID=UPI0013570257|nr:site-specific integrase [Geminicoccus flavidas]
MPKIGQKLVESLRADPARDYKVFDEEIRGFGLRVFPSGKKSWIFQYRHRGGRGGKTERLVIGDAGAMKAEEARTIARRHLAALDRGENPAEARNAARADLSVVQLIERWIDAGCPRAKPGRIGGAFLKEATAQTYRSGLRHHVVPLIGNVKLGKLARADIERMQRRIARRETAADPVASGKARGRIVLSGGEGIAGRITAYFAAVLTWGVREGLLPHNPAEKVHVIPAKRRERYLSAEEVERLGDALAAAEAQGMSPTFTRAIRLIALTGCRKSEALTLRWQDVDLVAGCLRLPDSKTGAKVIPLTTAARAFLASLPRQVNEHDQPVPWVFPAARGGGHAVGITKAFDRVRRLAGFDDDVSLHTLRHSFASAAVAAGGSLFLVGKVLGHSNAATTERYSHVALDPVHAVAELGGQRIATALAAGEARRRGTASADVVEIRDAKRGRRT